MTAAAGFPPLPAGSRIRVHRAEQAPAPVLEVTVEPPEAGCRRGCLAAWLLGAMGWEALAWFSVAALVREAGGTFEPFSLLVGSACTAAPLLLGGAALWASWPLLYRTRLTARPGEIDVEWEWIGRTGAAGTSGRALTLGPGDRLSRDGMLRGHPHVLAVRVAGRWVRLAPEVTFEDWRWLGRALGAVGASGRAGGPAPPPTIAA